MKQYSLYRRRLPSWLAVFSLIIPIIGVVHPRATRGQDTFTQALPTAPVMIRSVNSNKVIDIFNGQNSDGARIQQYDAWSGSMQQ